MYHLNINENSCLYLNHKQLVDNLYGSYLSSQDAILGCSLKSDLFNYEPRRNSSELEKNSKNKQCRKRKLNDDNDIFNLELKSLIEPFLKHIQNEIILTNETNCMTNIPRTWENFYNIVKLKGCNNTSNFQNVNIMGCEYIIPPFTTFFNYDCKYLNTMLDRLNKYDIIILDIPWRNKYIKRLKKVKQPSAYSMLNNEDLLNLPIKEFLYPHSIVAIWCTNCSQHQSYLLDNCLPAWNLNLIHELKWLKLNNTGSLVSDLKPLGSKQPYEMLYIACHKNNSMHMKWSELRKIKFLCSIPSIIHSHKPPLTEWLKNYLPDKMKEYFQGLELFARYLQPYFTSIGLEVLKLMDQRLYIMKWNKKK